MPHLRRHQAPAAFTRVADESNRCARKRDEAAIAAIVAALTLLWAQAIREYARLQSHRVGLHGRGALLPVAEWAHRLEHAVADAIERASRGTYDDTLDIWTTACQRSATGGEMGVSHGLALLAAVAALSKHPPLSAEWKLALRTYAMTAVADVDRLVRAGLTAKTPVLVLTRRLKHYLVFGAQFHEAFPKSVVADLVTEYRALCEADHVDETEDAGRRFGWQSRRTARSEVYGARFAAEVAVMRAIAAETPAFGPGATESDAIAEGAALSLPGELAVPGGIGGFLGLVGVQWRVSSEHPPADVCDGLAHTDWFGLGGGVYPVSRVPGFLPHPHCRCVLEAVWSFRVASTVRLVTPAQAMAPWAQYMRPRAVQHAIELLEIMVP